MFLGEYTHTIDDKGRVTIPAKFRNELQEGLVVTRGFDRNLMLYSVPSWQALYDNLIARPLGDIDVRAFRRRVFSGAIDLKPDKQGRIVLPQYLRQFAGMETDVVITGMGSYLEIWDAKGWQAELDMIENSNDVARWSDLGI